MKMQRWYVIVGLVLALASQTTSARQRVDDEDRETRMRHPIKEADSGMELRKIRRAAIGLQAAGSLGLGGALLELNMSPQWGFSAGFGGGEGFQAVAFQSKYVLAGEWLMPYMSFGYAHWMSIGKSSRIEKTSPAILGEKLLNDDEKAAGEFRKNLLYPGFGLQFLQLKGEWAGSSIFAEITVLLDLGNFVAAPTGTLGFLYYF